jgi:hypothetical protein
MAHAGAFAFDRNSPIGGAVVAPRPAKPAPEPAREPTLAQRLDAKLAELEGRGYLIQWLEIGEAELIKLFSESGEDAVRLDPDPAVDKAWYGQHEVRATDKSCVWIWLEGEIDGETSAHVID